MARRGKAQHKAAGPGGPDVSATAPSMSVTLRKTIELAGAVRDLVYHKLTGEQPFIAETTRMFNEVRYAVPYAPDDVYGSFAAALAAVESIPDPAAGAILEAVGEQVERSMSLLAYYGASQAAAGAFATAFPDEAAGLANGHARPDRLRMLARVFQGAIPRGLEGWPLKGPAKAAFERRSRAAASRTAKAAAGTAVSSLRWQRRRRRRW